MSLLSEIVKYFSQNERLHLKGLGTLVLHHVPSCFDEEKGTFCPPSQKLEFVSEEQDEHGIVSFISAEKTVSEKEAESLWNDFCLSVKQQLETENQYDFLDLGILKKTTEGFLFQNKLNLADENFGFSYLKNLDIANAPSLIQKEEVDDAIQTEESTEDIVPQINTGIQTPELEITQNEEEKQEEDVEITPEPSPVEEEKDEENTKKFAELSDSIPYIIDAYPKRKRNFVWPLIAILSLLFLLTISFWCFVHPNCPYLKKIQTTVSSFFVGNKGMAAYVEDSVMVILPEATEPTEDGSPFLSEKDSINVAQSEVQISQPKPLPKTEPQTSVTTSEFSYPATSKEGIDIICAFFKDGYQAMQKCEQMKSKGYDAYVIMPSSNRFYVSIGSFAKKDDAINFMRDTYNKDKMDLFLKDWNKK